MSRKSLILCLSVLAVLVVGLGLAVAFLYSGTGTKPASSQVADESRYLLLPAVPADAVAVFCSSDAEDADSSLFSGALLRAAGSARTVVSVHHSGKGELKPLYVFDAGRASSSQSETASSVLEAASANGMYAETVDCSSISVVGKSLSSRTLVVVSEQENLVRSSVRHLQEGVSIMDASGFAEASAAVSSGNVMFLANSHSQRLLSAVMTKRYSGYSSFLSRFAQWTVFSMDRRNEWKGAAVYEKGTADFMSVFESSQPVSSSLSGVLPSYTLSAAVLSVKETGVYAAAYENFVDSRQELPVYRARQQGLARSVGMSPSDFVKVAGVTEVAKASFKVAGQLENVNLMKVGKDAVRALFSADVTGKGYEPAVHDFAYSGFISSVFGKFFELEDESCYTFVNGWVVSGSRVAITEYIDALEYTLKDQMTDAGHGDLLASEAVFSAYFSFTEDPDSLRDIFTKEALSYIRPLTGGSGYCPFVFRVTKDKKHTALYAELVKAQVKRSKAPEKERDTTVVIPQGPFEVKNSGTGKVNRFYQNSHLSLCLSEDGKDLWGIPFKEKICGHAQTIDYYANGKLQILFGAGSRIYLLDRLGRFVKGFPVDLGKEILLGPQPYDFNGTHKYNAMVLHKDNTLEMYNLKGQKPESWKGIKVEETIKGLPEVINVGGKSFWVVRTSIQTLIYPFVGGESLTTFEGDKKIRPDSPVTVLDVTSVEVECYDGHKRTVKLK